MMHITSPPTSKIPNFLQFPTNQTVTHFFNSSKYHKINNNTQKGYNSVHSQSKEISQKPILLQSCKCGRRHFLERSIATTTLLHTCLPSLALDLPNSSSMKMLEKIHPPRPDWYEEFYASVLNNSMKEYEAEVSGYKSQLFDELRGQANEVLEIGMGTGPNLKYYATDARTVYGVDPNRKMEKYARGAAEAAGVLPENFRFIQAVGEALPLNDASVDAVIGTLVLCSVDDVHQTLQEVKRVLKPGGLYLFVEHIAANDGTSLRLLQNILNPLQELLADGCHLTRETGSYISQAGFSNVDSNTTFISSFLFVNPHLYGIAQK